MSNKELFKEFVTKHSELASHVNSGNMTWQKFYEMFILYGENSDVWNNYLSGTNKMGKIGDLIKNVDLSTIKEHINTAQKALDFVQELTGKDVSNAAKIVSEARPLNKFFED